MTEEKNTLDPLDEEELTEDLTYFADSDEEDDDDIAIDDDDDDEDDDDITIDDDDDEDSDDDSDDEDDDEDEEDDDEEDDDEDDDFGDDDIVINDIDDDDDDEDDEDDEDEEDENEVYSPSPTSSEEDGKFKDLYMRKCADLDNFKKRAQKERSDILRFGNEGLIRDILGVVDNLQRALEHIDNDEENTEDATGPLREGVELTIKSMFDTLKKFGLEEVSADGESFDPTKHEAISHEESEDHDSGKVVKELQKGYFLKDRLLRPSLVIVAK